MGVIPADKAAGDQLPASEVNLLRDGSFAVDANAGETINGATLPVACYFDNTDNEWKACDADDQAKLEFAGFAISNSTDGNSIQIQTSGVVGGFSGLTVGETYYVQDDKTIGTSRGTYEVKVGIAISATQILIQRGSFEFMGSAADSSDVITVPAGARYALVTITSGGGGAGYVNQWQLFVAYGCTTVQVRSAPTESPEWYVTAQAAWDIGAGTITLTSGGSSDGGVSGTAYFYR